MNLKKKKIVENGNSKNFMDQDILLIEYNYMIYILDNLKLFIQLKKINKNT